MATMNAQWDTEPDLHKRLALQADAEEPFFRGAGLQRLVEAGHATCGALVDRLKAMFRDHLLETWAPRALALLTERLDVHVAEYERLGLPAVCAASCASAMSAAVVVGYSASRSTGRNWRVPGRG